MLKDFKVLKFIFCLSLKIFKTKNVVGKNYEFDPKNLRVFSNKSHLT